MEHADFLIIGGGIAGLSAAARLVRHGRVVVVEGEEALGYHSSGRSVSFSHYGIGGDAVRALTAHSRPFFTAPLGRTFPTLYFADEEALPQLDALAAGMAPFTDAIRAVDAAEMAALFPPLRPASIRGLLDPTGLKLDADLILQTVAREIRAAGGAVLTGQRVVAIEPGWTLRTEAGDSFAAPVLVNAAGAWADGIAVLAGVAPLGLQPRRRTIIVVEAPPESSGWPFVHSVAGDFYLLPEAGRLLVSPVDEVPADPCDAQPEDYDLALAADRLEHYTNIKVTRIAHRWAGLRTFTRDRVPTAGFAPDATGFFWLAGQGGYGFQTAPAMAEIAEALITGAAWPKGLAERGVLVEQVAPERDV
ncbi:MAG TPA: FAD-binding oxidoreductase [Allosphingosinicella sp.]|nr:FAD-binding oxidoreductase [Allosphingosinicella sp.]